MKFKEFSPKQLEALCWWHPTNKNSRYNAIICDGAVRSGKTLCLSLSFLFWSFAEFNEKDFALCGKTIGSLRRNLVTPLLSVLRSLGFDCKQILSKNVIEITYRGVFNRFYLFGGKDESSASLIQGVTLAGVLFDEVALMPRSFVEQALARCSVENSRFWFNCNPEHPSHWFYLNWIQKSKQKNALYLHFKMQDNPSLSVSVLERYQNLYHGAFYKRYVLGEWTAAHGSVYPMFSEKEHVVNSLPKDLTRYIISCDYGTINPTSMGLWGFSPTNSTWYRIKEFYHSSRETSAIKTDAEYTEHMCELAGNKKIEAVVIDPSAASFIQCLRNTGQFKIIPAENQVLDGIRLVAGALSEKKLQFHFSCVASIKEFSLYRWNLEAGKDIPIKDDDHAMDEIRYFTQYALGSHDSGGFYAVSSGRKI